MADVCFRCGGTGKFMGLGMIKVDCTLCDDDNMSVKASTALDKIDRKSASYKKAIKDIMAINPDITRDAAVKLFEQAYDKN